MDLNRVQLTGRLDGEPQLWSIGDHPVAALRLACVRHWRAADGQVRRETDWYRLTAWEALAEWCGRCLHAGDRIYAEGQLRLNADGRHEILLDRLVLLARPTPPAASAAVAVAATRQAA